MGVLEQIKCKVTHAKIGQLYSASQFKDMGPRSSVYKALSRLKAQGLLVRVGHGLYTKVDKTSQNRVLPGAEAVVRQLARKLGGRKQGVVQPHGAEVARRLGLSTQMPLRPHFEGNVGQQTLHLGRLVVKLKPAVRAVRPLLGSPAGEALSALLFLGKQQVTPQTIARVKGQLSEEQFESLRRHATRAWLTRMLE